MLAEISNKIKCPRGDCLHTKCEVNEPPCSGCTCNQFAEMPGRTFRFTPKSLPVIRKESTDDKKV